jgi:hypothetical protein
MGATTLSMMTFRTTTLSMKGLFATLNIRDTQHVNALVSSAALLIVAFYFLKFNYSECLGASPVQSYCDSTLRPML